MWRKKKEYEEKIANYQHWLEKYVCMINNLEIENKKLKEKVEFMFEKACEYRNKVSELREILEEKNDKIQQMQENYEHLNDAFGDVLSWR